MNKPVKLYSYLFIFMSARLISKSVSESVSRSVCEGNGDQLRCYASKNFYRSICTTICSRISLTFAFGCWCVAAACAAGNALNRHTQLISIYFDLYVCEALRIASISYLLLQNIYVCICMCLQSSTNSSPDHGGGGRQNTEYFE